METYIPPALLDRADLLAEEAELVSERGINWRGRMKELGTYGLSGGSASDRRSIVQFMAALETRRMETGSLR